MSATVRIRARDRWLAVLALLAFLLVCFAATADRRGSSDPIVQRTYDPVSLPVSERATTLAPIETPPPAGHHWHFTFPWHELRQLLVLAAAGGLILLIWFIVSWLPRLGVRRRPARAAADQEATPDPVPDRTEDISRALSTALVAIELGDANRAVVACWIRLEQIAEELGFARQPWETSTELVSRWLAVQAVPPEPLNDLAELYREARYSDHVMSPAAVERARTTVTRLRQAFVLEPGTVPRGGGHG